jgi:hypothetical protein
MPDKSDKRDLSTEEILAADIASLTPQQMQTRIQVLQVLKAEQELEVAEHQNRAFQDAKEERQRQAANKTQIIEAEAQRLHDEQRTCKHQSGGKGMAGFFNGDGKQGRTVATQRLPTGEIYHLCFRCQKEWRLPKKADVVAGRQTLAQYRAQELEFYEVQAWDKPMFSTDSGEIPGSVQFRIPRLEQQKAKDDLEFDEFLTRTGART